MRYGLGNHGTVRLLAVAILLVGVPMIGAAQEGGGWQERFNEAVELAKAGDHAGAVEACLEVWDALPQSERSRADKLLGYAYMKLEMLPEAWHHLTAYRAAGGTNDETAGEWLSDVESRLPGAYVRLELTCDVPGTVLDVPSSAGEGEQLRRPCPVVLWLAPGEHNLLATTPDERTGDFTLHIRKPGDSGKRTLRFLPKARKTAPPKKEVPDSPLEDRREPVAADSAEPPAEEPPSPEELSRRAEYLHYYQTEWASLALLGTSDGLGVLISFLNFRWRWAYLELFRTQLGSSWSRTEKMVNGMYGSVGAGFGVPIHFGAEGRYELRLGLDLKAVAFHLTGDVTDKSWVKDADGLVGPGIALRGTFVMHPPGTSRAPSLQVGLEVLGMIRLYPGPDSLDWKVAPGLSLGAIF